jgi:enoyl-CoA hydratase/carnithine racemase
MSDRVTISVEGGVADVRLNRPDKMNALDGAMFSALAEAGEQLKSDASVRAVVLSGEGRAFCAGLDFGSFSAMAGGDRPAPHATEAKQSGGLGAIGDTGGRITHLGQQAAWVWQEVPVPVIAAVHGVAFGGGIQIALGADLRYVTADARLSVMEIRWGLVPDMTGTVTLARLVGLDVAKELTFTGRQILGDEAVRIGVATRVCDDPLADALATAREIAGKSPAAVRAAKRLLNQTHSTPLADQLAAERTEIGRLIGTPNQIEAVMANMEKRDPVFRD